MIYPKRGLGGLLLRGKGWVFVLLMVAGTIALAVGGVLSLRALHLETDGVEAVGTITGLEIKKRGCGKKNRSTCTDYWISYQFTPETGLPITDRKAVEQEFYQTRQIGGALPLRYVAGQPEENEIEPGAARNGSWIGVLLGCAMWLAVGVLGGKHVTAMRRAVFLREQGVMRRTQVREVRQTNIKVNKQPLYRIIWDGPPGESWAARQEDLPRLGEDITVYAHPEGVWPAVWEGDVGSR